jgi:hypothetical protein
MIADCENTIGNGGSLSDSGAGVLGEPVRKLLTFVNNTGVLSLFTVTGRVVVRIIPVCTVDVASAAAANIRLGTSSVDNAMIVDTLATDLDAEEIWIDASPDSKVEPLSAIREYIVTNGDDIILTLDAQVDSGAIEFACYWFPVSADGNVVPA